MEAKEGSSNDLKSAMKDYYQPLLPSEDPALIDESFKPMLPLAMPVTVWNKLLQYPATLATKINLKSLLAPSTIGAVTYSFSYPRYNYECFFVDKVVHEKMMSDRS